MKSIKNLKNKKILAVTLARGGSKSIENKNIVTISRKPLIYYTIKEAQKSRYINDYIVSTDNEEIAKIARKYRAQVPFIRDKTLSLDSTPSSDALLHALAFMETFQGFKYDYVIELMVTNPFKTYIDIDRCIEMLHRKKADSVIAVHQVFDHHPARMKKINKGRIEDFCVHEKAESRRQDLKPQAFVRSGAIYALNRDWFVENGKRYGSQNSLAYILDEDKAINIDTMIDLELARILMKAKK